MPLGLIQFFKSSTFNSPLIVPSLLPSVLPLQVLKCLHT